MAWFFEGVGEDLIDREFPTVAVRLREGGFAQSVAALQFACLMVADKVTV